MPDRAAVRRFFAAPKGLLIALLSLLVAIAATHEGLATIAPGLLGAVAAAALLDACILRRRRRRWVVPDGAILTAMLVAMVLSAQGAWYLAPVVASIGVLSKYVVRSRAANVFNPAALALVVGFYAFDTGQSWWGALPDVEPLALQGALAATGLFIVDRVNKTPLWHLSFLGCYFLLFTATAYTGDAAAVAEVFRTPDLQAALFFAFFILTDPPTSPVRHRDQVICGVIVAAVAYAAFELLGAVCFLLIGVLVGNVWEAWRRATLRSSRGFPHGVGTFLREISPWRPHTRATPI